MAKRIMRPALAIVVLALLGAVAVVVIVELENAHASDGRTWLEVVASWDWSAIGAIAVAAATFVLALYAAQSTGAAREAVNAANREAEASGKAAVAAGDAVRAANATLQEMRLQRELEFQPHVTLTIEEVEYLRGVIPVPTRAGQVRLRIRNVGRGPALDGAAAFHAFIEGNTPGHQWGSSAPFDLASGESLAIDATLDGSEVRARLLTQDGPTGEGMVIAVGYQDLQGSRYRLLVAGAEFHTEVWRGNQSGVAPEWVTWVERP